MNKKFTLIVALAMMCIVGQRALAQVAALPFTASLDTFAVIVGDTLDQYMDDDKSFNNIPIGFDFYYGGALHQTMSVNTNGYIELDTNGTFAWFNILSGPRNNVIAPFGADLRNSSTNASLQYLVSGTAPNRICTIQWHHYSYFAGQGDLNFQILLYETSNCIKFIYGANSLLTNPLNTQIGLRGSTNLDFQVLGDTSCSWAFAYPYPAITTFFPVSLNCSMPSGFAFNFGACKGGNANFGFLNGKVFDDANGNGMYDNNENGIANKVINMQPGNYFVSTNAQGNYTFFFVDSSITYSLSTAPKLYWNQTSMPTVLTCQPATQSTNNLDFGFMQIPNIHEVSIYCPGWNAKPAQPEPMPITYQNNGTSIESDTITFEMDSLYSFISATPAPLSVNGQTITWYYSNLAPGQSGSIMLHLLPDTNAILGNYLDSKLTIGPIGSDTIASNNVVNLHQLISNSWDPNDKLADPSGMIFAGTTIHFTVHFQNTGTAAADNVTIHDNLDPNLDILSFQLLGASHPVNLTMDGNGHAQFTFYNIQLPDSGTDFAGSNGYVTYSMATKNNLPPGTVINNTAGIVFDFNPPIITNTTADTIIVDPLGLQTINAQFAMATALPNPTKDFVVFKLTDEAAITMVNILSIQGVLVLHQQLQHSPQAIDIRNMAAGTYIAEVHTLNSRYYIKFVKQ